MFNVFNKKNVATLFLSSFVLIGCDRPAEQVQQPETTEINPQSVSVDQAENDATTTQQNIDLPELVVAVDSYPPYALKNDEGVGTGFDKAILDKIGEQHGFTVVFNTDPWVGIFDRLDNNSRDIVASGVPIVPEYQKIVSFSKPYANKQLTVAYLKENNKISSLDDLAKLDLVIAAQEGDSYISKFVESYDLDDDSIKEMQTSFLITKALVSGSVDAVFAEEAVLKYYLGNLQKDGTLNEGDVSYMPVTSIPKVPLGFAVKKGNDELLSKLNSGIEAMEANGELEALHNEWLQ